MRWGKFTVPVLASILILGAFTVGYSIDDAFAKGNGQPKVTICHVDQETGEEKTISISNKAVSKHIAKHLGDYLGECVDEPEPFCGDGNLDPGEQCDDGNTTSGDGCDSSCMIENPSPDNLNSCICQDGSQIILGLCIESCLVDVDQICENLCLVQTGTYAAGVICFASDPFCAID